jgi:hypothetical protein
MVDIISKQALFAFQVWRFVQYDRLIYVLHCIGFWRLKDKIGLPLDEIHVSGNVPQCKASDFFMSFEILKYSQFSQIARNCRRVLKDSFDASQLISLSFGTIIRFRLYNLTISPEAKRVWRTI